MERLVVEETYNQLGEIKAGVVFDILFTTNDPNVVNTAKEHLKSTSSPEVANPGVINVYQGKYRHVIFPRVATTATGASDSDKRRYWGIASSELSSFYLGMWEAPHLIPPKENGEDMRTDDLEFANRVGFGICVVGANWIKWSSGDGEA